MAFFDIFDKGLHFFGYGGDEICDFPFRAFCMKQNASVGKIAHGSRNFVFASNFQCLKTKSDALDVPFKPNIRVVNLFVHAPMQTSSRAVAKKIFSQANRGNA